MGEPGEKYHAADTSYIEESDAEYNASDFNYQIVDLSGDIICLCPTAAERDMVLKLLNTPTELDKKLAAQDVGHADQELRKNI